MKRKMKKKIFWQDKEQKVRYLEKNIERSLGAEKGRLRGPERNERWIKKQTGRKLSAIRIFVLFISASQFLAYDLAHR